MNLRYPYQAGAVALAAALSACGGGGGDDSTTITVPTGARVESASAGSSLTSDNYAAVSAPLIRAVASATAGSGLVTGAGAAREQAAAVTSRATDPGSPLLLSRVASQLMGRASLRVQPQATESESLTCLSGTGIVTADDADNNGKLSAGDVVTFTGDNCVLDSSVPAISGTFSMAMEAVALDSDEVPTGFQVLVSAISFSAGGYGSMNGSSRLWASGLDGSSPVMRISHLDTVVSQAGLSVPYRFDVYVTVGGMSAYEITGGIVVGGQTYAIQSTASFVGTPPSAGGVRLVDAAGNTVFLTALSNGLNFIAQYALSGTTGAGQPSFTGAWADYSTDAQ